MSSGQEPSEPSSSKDPAHPSLSALASECRHLLEKLNSSFEAAQSVGDGRNAKVYNSRGRFNVWGANLTAFRTGQSKSSIDWRLRKAPLMEAAVRAALGKIKYARNRALSIQEGELPNRGNDDLASLLDGVDRDDSENRDLIEFLSRPTSELDELLQSIESSVDRLFRLAMLIRRDARNRAHLQLPLSAPAPGLDPTVDNHATYLKDLFPKAKQTPWLQERLVRAFYHRRQSILELHKRPEAIDPDSSAQVASTSELSIMATTFEDRSIEGHSIASSVQSTATSFATACSTDDNGDDDVPDLTQLVLHGIQLQYDEVFECPFCRVLTSVSSKYEWKRHVFNDLRPYVCTFETCTAPLFVSRREWASHEQEFHRRERCCNRCDARFTSQGALKNHLVETHAFQVPDDDLSALLKLSERPTKYHPPGSCPLCDEWNTQDTYQDNTAPFYEHLGRHFQHLAISAIPIAIDGLEILMTLSPSLGSPDILEDAVRLRRLGWWVRARRAGLSLVREAMDFGP